MSVQGKSESVVETEQGTADTGGRVRLPRLLRMFWVASAATFGLTLLVAWVEHRMGLSPQRYDPLSDPLFGDLRWSTGMYKLLHTAAFFYDAPTAAHPDIKPMYYPPFSAMVLAPFYAAASPVGVFLALSAAWLGATVWGVRGVLVAQGISGMTATLFPLSLMLILFPGVRMVHEGNVELVLWIFAAGGVWAFMRGRDNWAAILWGLAAAMKLYPVILLILLLPRRRYRAIAAGVVTFLGATMLSLTWLGPTIGVAWRGSVRNVFEYQSMRVSEWSLRELMANHSVFGLVKLGALMAGVPPARLSLPYYACGALVMALAFFRRLWTMPVANQLLAVTVFMVALPPISYFHTLVHLYAPLLLLMLLAIRAEKVGARIPGLGLMVMLCVPLFAACNLLTFPRVMMYNGLVDAVLLVVLFVCAIEYPFALGGKESTAV